jgi:uncharacterized repeat protein (TIGR01451 family)
MLSSLRSKTSLRWVWLGTLLGLLVGSFVIPTAFAFVAGRAPTLLSSHSIFGNARGIGATLMLPDVRNPESRSILLASSPAQLSGLPTDAVIERAYLFWTGSLAEQGVPGPTTADPDVTFSVADGTSFSVSAGPAGCTTVIHPTQGRRFPPFYYCRADVTAQVATHPLLGSYNGSYRVGGVNASAAAFQGNNCIPGMRCQAKYAAWSMVVIYSAPSETVQRDIRLYDGFLVLDHEDGPNGSRGVTTFTISGFQADDNPQAELTYFAVEGDDRLGQPPQNLLPPGDPSFCTVCNDSVTFNGTKLSDSTGQPDNIFNESLDTGGNSGVDIDRIDVSALVPPRSTSATIRINAGSGPVVPAGTSHGGGELFGFGWTLLSLSRPAPNLRSSQTTKTVNPVTAGQGERVAYSVTVANTGSADATNTRVVDTLPTGVTYRPGTLQIGGVPCTDAADGDACTVSGRTLTINLGVLPHLPPNNSRQIAFLADVATNVTDGQRICNRAAITSTQTPTPFQPPEACFTVQAPQLSTPQKTDRDLDGGVFEPEDIVQFTVAIRKVSASQATALRFLDDMPANLQLLSVVIPAGATNNSSLTGGANGTGRVDVSDITIPANLDSVNVTILAQVDSEAEFIASGVAPGAIDGRTICNQGRLRAPFLSADLLTDDPDDGGATDRTCFTLVYRPALSTSVKTGSDLNGGRLEPRDRLRYTLTLNNTGNREATLDITDNLPPFVRNFAISGSVPGSSFSAPPAGSNNTGLLTVSALSVPAGGSRTISFDVELADTATDGAAIQNCASFTVAERASENRTICSTSLAVFARPDLSSASKTVSDSDGGDVHPGDTLDYTITVRNDGNRSATNMVIRDVVAANLTAIGPLDGGVFVAATRTITWNVGTLAVGATATVRFRAAPVSPLPNGTIICNQATIDSAELADQLTDNPATAGTPGDPTCVTVVSAPDFSASTKSVNDANGAPARPGDTLTYSVTVTNSGTETATNLVVSDRVANTLTGVTALDGGSFNSATRTLRWTLASLSPGASSTLRFSAQIVSPLANATVISNQAFISADQVPAPGTPTDDPTTAIVDDPTNVTVSSAADLSSSTKAVADQNGGDPQPGDSLTYTITLINTGDAVARQTTVSDIVDANLDSITPLDGGVYAPATRTITWPAADVVPGTNRALRFRANVRFPLVNGTIVCNQASASSGDLAGNVLTDDPSTPAIDDRTCVTVVSRPDLSTSTKTVRDINGGDVRPGDRLEYTITVANSGTQDARNIVVSDIVDANLANVTPLDGGSYNTATRTITWSLATVAARGQTQLRFNAEVARPLDNGTRISNQASIVASGLPAVLTDDPATPVVDDATVVTVSSAPDFRSSLKTVTDPNGGLAEPGDTLSYTLTIRNRGDSIADNVVVSDPLDSNLTFVSANQGGTFNAQTRTITWNATSTSSLSRVGIGSSDDVTLTFSARLTNPLANGTAVCNQGRVVSDEVSAAQLTDNPATPAVGDTTCITVSSAPDLSGISKTVVDVNGGDVRPGDRLDYTITLTNTGNEPARELVVRDPVSRNLTSIAPGQGGRFDAASSTIIWDRTTTPALASLAPGASVTLTFSANVLRPLDNTTPIVNQARVSGANIIGAVPSDDPTTAAVDDATTVRVVSEPDLTTSIKTVSDENGGEINPGDSLLYTITLRNSGDGIARNVTVTDLIDANLDQVTPLDSGVFTPATRTISWQVSQVGLTPAGDVTLRFGARIRTPLANNTVISNQATINVVGFGSTVTDDPTTAAPDDATRVTVISRPDLSTLQKNVSLGLNDSAGPGDVLTYTITVENSGTEDARNVLITDTVDTSVLEAVTALDGGVFDQQSSIASWTIATLAVGQQVTLRFTGRVRADARDGSTLRNQAFAERAGVPGSREPSNDPRTPRDDDSTDVRIVAVPVLEQFTKAVRDENGGDVVPGDRLAYTLIVRNTGKAFAFNVSVEDVIPRGLDAILMGEGGIFFSNTRIARWTPQTTPALARVAPGAEIQLTFGATVAPGVANGTVLRNQATLRDGAGRTEPSDDPTTQANDDSTDVTVVSLPKLETVEKRVRDLNGGLVQPNDVLEYEIRVVNTGSGQATGVRLVDNIPAHTSYIPASTRLNGTLQNEPGGVPPLRDGLLISSPGAASGVLQPGTTAAATVTFRVRVEDSTQAGTIISNQGLLRVNELPLVLTDDPSTAPKGDATQVVVGSGPNLDTTIKTFGERPIGDNGNDRFDVGEGIAYRVTITNTGTAAAHDVLFRDPIDGTRAQFISGTLALDGRALSDGADGDAGSVSQNRLRVLVGTLEPGRSAVVTYQARILSGPVVTNQGTVTSRERPPELTDADGNEANGDSKTVVAVGSGVRRLVSNKSVEDVNGGSVSAGDQLSYRITVSNEGTNTEQVDVVDNLPATTRLVSGSIIAPRGANVQVQQPPAGANQRGSVAISNLTIPPGERLTIVFRVTLDSDVRDGTAVCNTARTQAGAGIDLTQSEPACVLVGSAVGAGAFSGRVFRDIGADNRQVDDNDLLLSGYQVLAMPLGDPNGTPKATAMSDSAGRYLLRNLLPGPYVLRVLSSSGAQMAALAAVTVPNGRSEQRDLPIDPMGVVYNAVSGKAVAGARVSLYYDQKDPLEPGKKVSDSALGQGQQDQLTDANGYYRFDAPAGRRYRIAVAPISPALQFPSSLIPQAVGFAQVGADDEVVANDQPDPKRSDAVLTYYLRFAVDNKDKLLFNNHIPLDPLSALIKLEKRADRSRASIGESVTYTVSVENRSAQNFTQPGSQVTLQDVLPKGVRFLRGSVRRIRVPRAGTSCLASETSRTDVGNQAVCYDSSPPLQPASSGRLLSFGPFPLGAGESMRLIYRVAIGLDSKPGVYRNLAVLKDNARASELSNRDEARVLVQPDPDFDQGLLLGKVFCDNNKDRRQQRGERGVAGARIYLDDGNYAITDRYGKYHLRGINPGLRLVKIDSNTLRPGSTLTTEASRVVQFTRGLPAKVSFGVSCRTHWVEVQQVKRKKVADTPDATGKKPPVVPVMSIAGDIETLSLTVDGRTRPLYDVDLLVSAGNRKGPAPKDWQRPAPTIAPPRAGKTRVMFDTRLRHGGKAAGQAALAVRGWRLTVWRVEGEQRVFLRRFSGAGQPPVQMLWDGTQGGKQLLRDGRRYAVQLSVVGRQSDGGRSAVRSFAVSTTVVSPKEPRLAKARYRARLDGLPLKVDARGRFAKTIGRARRDAALYLELSRANGKQAYTTLGKQVPTAIEIPDRVLIHGDLTRGRVLVGQRRIDTSLLNTELRQLSPPRLDRRGRLRGDFLLAASTSSSDVLRWTLRIYAHGGQLLRTLRGPAPLPARLRWDGKDQQGKQVTRPGGRYQAQLTLLDLRGNIGRSAKALLLLPARGKQPSFTVRGRRLFSTRRGDPLGRARAKLRAALRTIAARPDSERYRIEARIAPPLKWQSERWASYLKAVKKALGAQLEKRKLSARVELSVNAVPLPPAAITPRARRQRVHDRRREALVLMHIPQTQSRQRSAAAIRVDGQTIAVDGRGRFHRYAPVTPGAAMVLELRDAKGRRAVLLLSTTPKTKTPKTPKSSTRPTSSTQPRAPNTRERRARYQLAPRVASAKPNRAPQIETLQMRGGAKLSIKLAKGSGQKPAITRRAGTKRTGTKHQPLEQFGRGVIQKRFKGVALPGSQPSKRKQPALTANQLQVDLPKQGTVLRAHSLTLRGKTHPQNTVTINGKKARLDETGRFVHTVKLPEGKSTLEIRSRDAAGNEGRIDWPVTVSDKAFFLMALAEGAIGQAGVRLDEDHDHSRLKNDSLLLRGRAVVYLKGRMKGKYLFSKYMFTAHLDTAKRRDFEEFFDQVVDPNRYYPIYGDSAQHVRDVNARDKLYILVKADDSTLRFGNFRAGIRGVTLLRYDRALYGAKIDLRKRFANKKVQTRLQAYYSRDDSRLSRDLNMLRATGGSIYYLRHGQVIEGSERVRIIVRERDTGLELAQVAVARDTDYRIDYAGGRIMFTAPVASVADAGFTAANPTLSGNMIAGHPVFIEVTYEHQSESETGRGAWGVQGKTTLFDTLTVGGTFVSEERAAGTGGNYRLYGAELTWRHGKGTQISAEFARSESTNMANFISEDGGITYLSMNTVSQASVDARARNSNAYAIRAQVELSDFIKKLQPGQLSGTAYFDRKERGFFSGGTILDQGRTRYGGAVNWQLSKQHKVTLRHDGARALLPQLPVDGNSTLDPLQMREVQNELTRLRYRLRRGNLELTAEYSHLFMRDSTTTGVDSHRDTIGVLGRYRVLPWLTLTLGQDAIFAMSGDDPQLGSGAQQGLTITGSADWADRLMTTLGVEIRLSKSLSIQLLETVRWSGDNATAIGLKTKLSKTASTYLRQVLGSVDGKISTMTVVGAEDRFGPQLGTRTYGEYQLDAGVAGRRNRAILGLVHKWTPLRGLSITGGYEHQQVFGARQPDGTPVGDSQRDVVHAGLEFTRPRRWKLSTRAELRFDSASGVTGLGPGGFSPNYSATAGTNNFAVNATNVDPRAGFGPGHYADRQINVGHQLAVTPGERWQILTRNAASWSATRDLTLMARANYYRTYNTTEKIVEAEALELGFGAAFRPVAYDWLDILFKYSRILEMRPISLTDHLARRRTYDVVSLAAIVELPWLGMQLVEKFAYKRVDEQLDILPGESLATVLHTLLWINRINLHIAHRLDAGIEYRLMRLFAANDAGQLHHGVLLEAGYWLHHHVRLGLGYNFTSFSDNEFAEPNQDAGGVFFRVVGRY